MKTVQQLYPAPYQTQPLRGLYLAHQLHTLPRDNAPPLVYANFLSSLDGRIALEDSASGVPYLPKSLTTPDDFRLFLELHAQADCLVTHGGYLRSLAAGRLGNILQVGQHPDHRDLADWRSAQGLPAQPAVVVASASLNFELPDSLNQHGQTVHIAIGAAADPARVAAWRQRGYDLIFAGSADWVEGAPLIDALAARGYRRIYLIAGPHMLDTVLRAGRLQRLYQTITHQIMGGTAFHTVAPGDLLGNAGHLKLRSLYYDCAAPDGSGQFFCCFDAATPT